MHCALLCPLRAEHNGGESIWLVRGTLKGPAGTHHEQLCGFIGHNPLRELPERRVRNHLPNRICNNTNNTNNGQSAVGKEAEPAPQETRQGYGGQRPAEMRDSAHNTVAELQRTSEQQRGEDSFLRASGDKLLLCRAQGRTRSGALAAGLNGA